MQNESVNRWHFKIDKEIPSSIFELPDIQTQLSELFSKFKVKIDNRIKEITDLLDMESYYELSHDFILSLFKSYFCKHIASQAILLTFEGYNNYNLYDNILYLLTNGQMQAAIYGKIMIEAFERALRIIDKKDGLDTILYSSKIQLLNSNYISTKKQMNCCGECNCSCTCDAGCKGNWQKCTSTRDCNHHCGCYVDEMIKNWPTRTIESHSQKK